MSDGWDDVKSKRQYAMNERNDVAAKLAARQALDDAALELTRANQALWRLGVRDVVSPLHVDTAIAPTYLRLQRGGR